MAVGWGWSEIAFCEATNQNQWSKRSAGWVYVLPNEWLLCNSPPVDNWLWFNFFFSDSLSSLANNRDQLKASNVRIFCPVSLTFDSQSWISHMSRALHSLLNTKLCLVMLHFCKTANLNWAQKQEQRQWRCELNKKTILTAEFRLLAGRTEVLELVLHKQQSLKSCVLMCRRPLWFLPPSKQLPKCGAEHKRYSSDSLSQFTILYHPRQTHTPSNPFSINKLVSGRSLC